METAVRLAYLTCLLFAAGCSHELSAGRADSSPGGGDDTGDLAIAYPTLDLTMNPALNECGDTNPTCTSKSFGPPFPLQKDPTPDPAERDDALVRDSNGWLGLDQTHAGFDKMWIANSNDGTISKIDTKTIREVARYSSVTCYSLKTGGTQACDGTNGCCALDDWYRYQARKLKQPEPGHQQVQQTANSPSRTAIDWTGNLFVSNRAFSGQSSVTKIAASQKECIDRNGNGRFETSSDTNNDGVIDVDCNGDGMPDDLAGVKQKRCTNGRAQEFYGQDDECILWTTNTFVTMATGRPLALTIADAKTNLNDAWAGSYNYSNFVRIDGATGMCKDEAQLDSRCQPYGLTVDSTGIGWAPTLGGGKLCYFDTQKPANTGVARDPQWGPMQGYGVAMDRDQNVWVGSGVERYTPDRSNGFASLGNGTWMKIAGAFGIGIAADARNANAYFVYSCTGSQVLQIPASTIKPMKIDQQIPIIGWPTIAMACYGVGVDAEQNVWGVPQSNIVTRAKVDAKGNITEPMAAAPAGSDRCPGGDACDLGTGHYTYSDFTGFGLRNFTSPRGFYSYVVRSTCIDQGFGWGTHWIRFEWEAAVPAKTGLTARARDGKTPVPDSSWNAWSTPAAMSPIDLTQLPAETDYLEIEVDLSTSDVASTPKLKSAKLYYECLYVP